MKTKKFQPGARLSFHSTHEGSNFIRLDGDVGCTIFPDSVMSKARKLVKKKRKTTVQFLAKQNHGLMEQLFQSEKENFELRQAFKELKINEIKERLKTYGTNSHMGSPSKKVWNNFANWIDKHAGLIERCKK